LYDDAENTHCWWTDRGWDEGLYVEQRGAIKHAETVVLYACRSDDRKITEHRWKSDEQYRYHAIDVHDTICYPTSSPFSQLLVVGHPCPQPSLVSIVRTSTRGENPAG
jgi:hypothetical protein